jgi:tRNA nucleotidyltransferase (CCA-adding enzyme)
VSGTTRTVVLHPPPDVVWITRTLEDAGYATWAVGGAVRDELAGGRAGDWDLTTAARPPHVRRIFRRTVPLGIEHGTVGVIARSGRMYEVTTFRRDVETFGRKARVAFSDSLDEDLDRRDFTMNAVAWHPLTHELRDPHGGLEDLARGFLRTVGNPDLRFAEDRLRVLRALRFAGRFNLEIEPVTWTALRASSDKLTGLSAERIREELLKVLGGQRWPSRSLELYGAAGVLAALFPELEELRKSREEAGNTRSWSFVLRAVDRVSPRHRLVRLAALLHRLAPAGADADVRKPATTEEAARAAGIARGVLRRLRTSNADSDRVTHLIAQHEPAPSPESPPPELRMWIRRVGREHLRELFRLQVALAAARGEDHLRRSPIVGLMLRVRAILADNPPLTIGDLAIDGSHLRKEGIPPGPLYGELLRDLLDRVTVDPALNHPDALMALIRSRQSEIP